MVDLSFVPGDHRRYHAQTMKPPRSLKINDIETGTGPKVVPGDTVVCKWRCTRTKGDVLFQSDDSQLHPLRVGARDCCVGIEYGLLGMQLGGTRRVVSPPNLTYIERKSFPDLPEDSMLIYELTLVEITEKWDPEMQERLAGNA